MSDQPSRTEAVILLLEARQDHLPSPTLQRWRDERGPAPFRTIVCDRCQGKGKLRGGWLCQDCRGRGTFAIDAYTGEPVDTDEATWQELLSTTARCSRCAGGDKRCDRCQGSGVEAALFTGKADLTGGGRTGSGNPSDDWLSNDLRRQHDMMRHPAQAELDGCLGVLAEANPGARWLVLYVYERGEQKPECLLPAARLVLDWAVARLAGWMPERIVLPAEVYGAWLHRRAHEPGLAKLAAQARGGSKQAQARRDAEIRAMFESGGWSRSALARKFALSYRRVAEILQREAA